MIEPEVDWLDIWQNVQLFWIGILIWSFDEIRFGLYQFVMFLLESQSIVIFNEIKSF